MFDHFVKAQEPVYAEVLKELRAGRKRGHWMWFIFPQLAGLGTSGTAVYYGIRDLAHARAFAGHVLLGARLRECVALVNGLERRTPHQVFGYPDELKFRSCLTLFFLAANDDVFRRALDKFYGGELDTLTTERTTS